jgi:hypothetical protein
MIDRRPKRKWLAVWLSLAGLLVVAGANAHLVYVAATSQPACVPHVKLGAGQQAQFSAAKSACTGR